MTTEIITTGTTTTNDETKTKTKAIPTEAAAWADLLRDNITLIREAVERMDTTDNATIRESNAVIVKSGKCLCAFDIEKAIRNSLDVTADRICAEAVTALRDAYIDGRRNLPSCDARIAFDYLVTLITDCGARTRREYTVCETYDEAVTVLRPASYNLDCSGFAYDYHDHQTGRELEDKALTRLRAMVRKPETEAQYLDRVREVARACMDVVSAQRADCPDETAKLREVAIDLIKNLLLETGHCDRVNVLAAWDAVAVIGKATYDAYYSPDDKEWASLQVIFDAYDNASASTVTLAPEPETSGADLVRRVAEAEMVDDTNEALDDLLKIGHLTVDDLLKGIPHAGDTDPINVAAALVSGGLVCDPDGHVHVDPFAPTDAVNAYPRRIVNALLDCRMTIMRRAFDILSFDADGRTVQLTPDVFATIIASQEVPDEIWLPKVWEWQNDPWADRWTRHEHRYGDILDSYDRLYDDYNAVKRPCADIADDPNVMDDEEFDSEYDDIVLDESIIATGGWLLVEDEFDNRFYVNCLDIYGFDDARTISDAGSVWPTAPYQAIRARRHRAA